MVALPIPKVDDNLLIRAVDRDGPTDHITTISIESQAVDQARCAVALRSRPIRLEIADPNIICAIPRRAESAQPNPRARTRLVNLPEGVSHGHVM